MQMTQANDPVVGYWREAMSTSQPDAMTMDDFQAVVRRAGLDLEQQEMERLLPLYQQLLTQLAAIHDPELPLGLPADVFSPDWE